MSTYYYFHCTKCKEAGGCWTRQAWGWGNADLIDAFKFVMYHVRECGEEFIGMHSEHNDDDWANTSFEDRPRLKHLERTRNIFPHSNDWEFMNRQHDIDVGDAWIAAERADLHFDCLKCGCSIQDGRCTHCGHPDQIGQP